MNLLERVYSIFGLKDSTGTVINPATEDKQDTQETTLNGIETQQTSGAQKTQIVDSGDAAEEVDVVTAADDDTDLDGLSGLVTNAIMSARIDADTVKPVRMDPSTHVLSTIEYEHREIHAGDSFTCHYNNDVTNIGEMTVIAFNTPAGTKWIHLTIDAQSSAASYLALYENTSIDVDEGTTLPIYNRNRNSGTASVVSTIETSPVAGSVTSYNESQAAAANITTTTELSRSYLGSTSLPGRSPGSASRGISEFVLDASQQYAIVLAATTADDTTHDITLNWYEHIDKN